MNKEEIRQFKSLLNQGILRQKNILLDYKFQNSLLEIIKDYEQLQQENKQLKDNWNKLKEWLNNFHKLSEFEQWEIVKKMQELENGENND